MHHMVQRCPDGRWELARAYPALDLAQDVADYAGYRERAAWMLRDREVAEPIIPMIINFGADFHISFGGSAEACGGYGSFTAGLYGGYVDVAATGRSHCMQVNFTPPGAYRFFDLPLRELAGRGIPLDAILGRHANELAERLHESAGWGARFLLLDAFVRARLARQRAPSPGILWAWRTLVSSGGAVPAGVLASEIGCSRKHLNARFSIEIGETPKTAARILRFARARRAISSGRAESGWAGLASECGFADQAHLIREFRVMAGMTPVEYRTAFGKRDGLPPAEIR